MFCLKRNPCISSELEILIDSTNYANCESSCNYLLIFWKLIKVVSYERQIQWVISYKEIVCVLILIV